MAYRQFPIPWRDRVVIRSFRKAQQKKKMAREAPDDIHGHIGLKLARETAKLLERNARLDPEKWHIPFE
jgi:hypothetical protein